MAVRSTSVIAEPFVDSPSTVRGTSVAPEAFTNSPSAIRIPSIIVEVFKTFGCAFIPSPLPTATTRMIRRMRRTPHLSAEQVRQFFSKLQLDLQVGVGNPACPDPLVCLRWSNNGGKTWSNEHFVAAGKVGQYARRAIWRRLGQGRDRVYEITVSDPVAWRLLDAYLTAETGS